MGKALKVAVIAMQGDYEKHLTVLKRLGADAYPARLPKEIADADGIILPGGESTTIGKMLVRYGMDVAIKQAYQSGTAVYGTCAGMILMAAGIDAETQEQGGQKPLGLMDITVTRNAFGRQRDSFEAEVHAPSIAAQPIHGVFIRAPYVSRTGLSVDVLASYDDKVVLVQQGRLLGSAFHPELTDDDRVHRYFLSLIKESCS